LKSSAPSRKVILWSLVQILSDCSIFIRVYSCPFVVQIASLRLRESLSEKFAELRGQLWTDPAFLVLEVDESI